MQPLVATVPAAGVRLRGGDRARPRRRPAPQPRQVGHGRVIVGVGIDVVDVLRFEQTLTRTPGLRPACSPPASRSGRSLPSPPGSPPRRPWPRPSAHLTAALGGR
jgi:hypothetical protein